MPDGSSATVVGLPFRLVMLFSRVMPTGFDAIPDGDTLKRTRSDVWGNQRVVPSGDHSGPSAATVPSPIVWSVPTPVPRVCTTWSVFTLMIVKKPWKSSQLNAARYCPLGLKEEEMMR